MANKAIFLDRDDTLIEDPGYINNPDQVKLIEGAPEALSALKAMDYKLVVISNQSGVARGIVTEQALGEIHKRLEQLLVEKGVSLDRIYYCPFHPDGVIPKYRRESEFRKPNPGMLLAAEKDMDIDLKESWMVGNSARDIEAGLRAGCRTIMLAGRTHEQNLHLGEPNPDYKAVNLKEVVNIIKKHLRSSAKPPQNDQPAPLPAEPDIQPASPSIEQPADQSDIQVASSPPAQVPANKTDELLAAMLEQLKGVRRNEMFNESDFSVLRFMAGLTQVAVLACLLISVLFLMGPGKQTDRILVTLGFAVVLQIMALTFYIMHRSK